MDMKPFNCHEAGDGDLYRRDEEGASLRGHLGLLDDAMAAVVAPRKLRLRKTASRERKNVGGMLPQAKLANRRIHPSLVRVPVPVVNSRSGAVPG
jgi:hypothetical protein